MIDSPQAQQFERALQRVAYAHEHSEFYRLRLLKAGIAPGDVRTQADFARVPMVTKMEVIDDQVAAPPFGTLHIKDAGPLARVFCSGGTLLVGLTAGDLVALEEMFAEMFAILGVREGDLVDIASNFHWVVAGTVMDAALRRLGAGVIPGGPGLSDLRLDVLRRTGATVLQAFTPYAEKLGERLAELRELSDDGGQRHSLRLLLIGGELREANAKARLEALWSGAAARELYGTTEAGLNAVDCEYANGMHLSPQCFLEVVEPDTGQPVAPGSPGEIVITELFRSAQPFIRYRSGDLTEGLILDRCDCGLQTPRLGRIIGRKSDVLRVRGQFLYEALMRSCLNSFPRVDRWRVVVDRPGVIDTLILNVAPADGTTLGADDLTAIAGLLRSSCTLTFDVRAVEPSAIEDGSWFEDRREFTGAA